MPTAEWIAQRKLMTFWLTTDDAEAFALACIAKGVTKSEVLVKAVRIMLDTEEMEDGKGT